MKTIKNLALMALGFVGGIVTYAVVCIKDVECNGNVEYEDDNIKVTAGGNKKYDWAFAKVEYKQNKETEEE